MKSGKIIVGNWKMGPESLAEAEDLFKKIEAGVAKKSGLEVIICPSFVHLAELSKISKKKILLGAQDVFFESAGSYTGQVSLQMLKNLGVTHVIVGHSERRALGESDEMINKKVALALKEKIIPIVCIGETARDEDGQYLFAIKNQIEKALAGISRKLLPSIIIAYEPVWKIGADSPMDSSDIHQMMIFIKKAIVDFYKIKTSLAGQILPTPILYGGAVETVEAGKILREGGANGLLVGRQSLEPEAFLQIIKSA